MNLFKTTFKWLLVICLSVWVLFLADQAVLDSAQAEESEVLPETNRAGDFCTCGIKADGTQVCLGDNSFGQLGLNLNYLLLVKQ